MEEFKLITAEDFLPYRAISKNLDEAKRIEPHIIEAQSNDLIELLGEYLYFDLIKNIKAYNVAKEADANYTSTPEQQQFLDLLNGATYVYKPGTLNEITKIYSGLVPVLVYLTYARFVNRDNIRSTPAGFAIKTTMESTPISAKQITEEAGRAVADANVRFRMTEKFMRDKAPFFDKYLSGCACDGTGKTIGQRLHSPRNGNRLSRGYNRTHRR